MAIGDAYVEPEDIEDRTGRTDDGTFSTVADAASRLVERYTGRQFNKDDDPYDPVATDRRFVAADRCRLPVDDFHTLDDLVVEVNGTTLDSSAYDPRPWDGVINGQPGWPYFDLFRIGGYWPLSRRARVTVTAHWGWDAVPSAITLATLDAAAELVTLSASGSIGPVRSESIDGYSVAYLNEMFDGNMSLRAYMRSMYQRRQFGVA